MDHLRSTDVQTPEVLYIENRQLYSGIVSGHRWIYNGVRENKENQTKITRMYSVFCIQFRHMNLESIPRHFTEVYPAS